MFELLSQIIEAAQLAKQVLDTLGPPESKRKFVETWAEVERRHSVEATDYAAAAVWHPATGRSLCDAIRSQDVPPSESCIADELLARWNEVQQGLCAGDRARFFTDRDAARWFLLDVAHDFSTGTLQVKTPTREDAYAAAMRASNSDKAALWLTAGVDPTTAQSLAAAPEVGAIGLPSATILVIAGGAGVGKTLALLRAYDEAVLHAYRSEDAPLPVLAQVNATPLTDQIKVVQSRLGLARTRGVRIFADSFRSDDIFKLCSEFLELRGDFPMASLVMTSRRPPPNLEALTVPKLPQADANALVARIAKRNVGGDLYRVPNSFREALRNPLFATLTGSSLRIDARYVPRSTGQLLEHVVHAAIAGDVQGRERALKRLAVVMLHQAATAAPRTDGEDPHAVAELVKKGILLSDGANQVRFAVDLVRDWYGAMALQDDPTIVDRLLESPTNGERWRNALTIAFSSCPSDFALSIANKIARDDPGLAASSLEKARAPEVWPPAAPARSMTSETARDDWVLAMSSWREGFQDLFDLIGPVEGDGTMVSIDVQVDEQGLLHITAGNRTLSTRPNRCPAWATFETGKHLGTQLKELLSLRSLPNSHRALALERGWDAALRIMNYGSLYRHPIPWASVQARLEGAAHTAMIPGVMDPLFDVGEFRTWMQRQIIECPERLNPPWQTGSRIPQGLTGHPCQRYEDDELKARVTQVYLAALGGYADLVQKWFPKFRSRLHLGLLAPVRIEAQLTRNQRFGRCGMKWRWCASDSGVSSFEFVDSLQSRDRDGLSPMYMESRRLRGELYRGGIVGGSQNLDIFGSRPATELAYKWLWDDLAALSVVRGMLPAAPTNSYLPAVGAWHRLRQHRTKDGAGGARGPTL